MEPELRGESALAAIVFTDVEAFTPKMAANERHTLTLIQRDFQRMEAICQQYEGRVLKTLGDGLLLYFVSAEKAVNCALMMQKALAAAERDLPEIEILKHRIGIHLGDVYFSGNDVMGNGVNLAARLQTIAPPGGICISQTVYDTVKHRLAMSATYLGARQLKGLRDPVAVYTISPTPKTPQHKVFISYHSSEPDRTLAREFYSAIAAMGYEAFLAGENLRLGQNWAQRIEAELRTCDYFLLFLSAKSAGSEMVAEEVRRVKQLREECWESKPIILPVRVNFPLNSPLNYNLRGYLDSIQQREWESQEDTPHLIEEVLQIIRGDREPHPNPNSNISRASFASSPLQHPFPAAVPEIPTGQVDAASIFYVERPPIEERCYETIMQPGSLIRIKAPRQMGKTSLMAKILHRARQQSYYTVPLSFQFADRHTFHDLDRFLKWFCASVGRRLQLPNRIGEYWDEIFGSKDNCTAYFEDYLLANLEAPLALGLDEVDCIFQYPETAADFLGLLRAWHEDAKHREVWKKLRSIIVHSTEVYVPMNINQSPFNVGLPIELPEFTASQIRNLARLHGLDWQGEVEQLMDAIAGHPYLVRLALYHIARQDLSLEEVLEMAPTEAGLYSDHLRRHLWNLQQQPDLAKAMQSVAMASEPARIESTLAFKLRSMGLVKLQGNTVSPRSQLYRDYFRDRL
ncbi:MAG: AAA-like domain-containing protein [Cyanobacteriota bacterium]|nr:AAA-like domain-containing protein [Cyanobacteriota bacterium]